MLVELENLDSHPDRLVACPLPKHRMQVSTMERDARRNATPQIREVNFKQQPPSVVAEALARDEHRVRQHRLFEAECAQRPDCVAGQVHARPFGGPRGVALDDVNGEASASERACGREAGDTGADDQNSSGTHSFRRYEVISAPGSHTADARASAKPPNSQLSLRSGA